MVGKTALGKYRLLRSIGSGSNAEVFLAEPLRAPEYRVVVKRIHDHVVTHPKFSFDELNDRIRERLGRKVVVVGACIGTDAHTTGIDAIFNMKGYAGDYGLERYPWFKAHNLGAQVEPAALVAKALELKADAILVSQIVTQRDIHKENARTLVELAKQEGLFGKTILVFGGPRVDHKAALELGFDAGFGPGTKPSDVANYVYYRLIEKLGLAE